MCAADGESAQALCEGCSTLRNSSANIRMVVRVNRWLIDIVISLENGSLAEPQDFDGTRQASGLSVVGSTPPIHASSKVVTDDG